MKPWRDLREFTDVRTKLAIKVDAFLERHFPERRVFLKSDNDTRFIRLRPITQLIALTGSAALVAWRVNEIASVKATAGMRTSLSDPV